jgi:cyanophycinase
MRRGRVFWPTSAASLLAFLFVGGLAGAIAAQEFDEQFDHWPVDLKIKGRVVVAGDLPDPTTLREALRDAAGDAPAAGEAKAALLVDCELDDPLVARYRSVFESGDARHTPLAIARTADETAEQLAGLLTDCELFCWHSSRPLAEAQREMLLAARPLLQALLDRGGTIVAVGPAARLVSTRYLTAAEEPASVAAGLALVPDCIIETEYDDDGAGRGRLLSALARFPRCVGIGVEKGAAIVLSGRKMHAVGPGRATFLLTANERQPLRVQAIARQTSPRQPPEEYLIDLTEWRRDAIDRTLEAFPPAEPRAPRVENGALVIVGGGSMPEGLMARFVELAGGAEHARLVYVPCVEEDEAPKDAGLIESWARMGVQQTAMLHTKDRRQADRDEAFLAPLKTATGIWFGGGRQWNFADSYYGTQTHRLMKEVLKRGGVIGGSSAGASIQARYLARGTPIGNTRIMAPGYERGGLGFLSGVAIDQHFSQRGRHKDMTELVNRYPQLLGIGLDEGTAIVVRDSEAEVVGKGKAHFYDRRMPVYPDRPDYLALPAGAAFDLAERKVVRGASQTAASSSSEPARSP